MTGGSDVGRSILLLVEDSEADVEIVRTYLAPADEAIYDVRHVSLIEEALALLASREVDVILLDLSLPDSSGEEAVAQLRRTSDDTPIVVLTGRDDDEMVLRCIQAGAQDYLLKSEISPVSLKRAIEHALARKRESELRALRVAIARYRRLTSASSVTSLTARTAGIGSLRDRMPYEFRACLQNYHALLRSYVERNSDSDQHLRNNMQVLVTRLGDCGASPRDLIDIHTRVLEDLGIAASSRHQHAVIVEGRLFALEIMGLLVEYYRVGRRYYQVGDSV
ncbi:MAG: hypothetical protein AcusKO_22290 [Acuticoccus sp.]